MASIINLNDTTPAAPAGKANVKWQADAVPVDPTVARNVSAYVVSPELAKLLDVLLTSPADADFLKYSTSAGKWVNSPSAGVTVPNFDDAITPTGAVDGVNDTFTLPHTPSPAASLIFTRNGVVQRAGGADGTLTGSSWVFVAGAIPQTGDVLQAWYRY